MLVLLLIGITSCVSKPKKEIKLPPKPQRQELESPTNLKECAEMIVYYEALVEEWESWGETVSDMVNN